MTAVSKRVKLRRTRAQHAMSTHLVVDVQSLAHLAYELPWWREKCQVLGVQLHAMPAQKENVANRSHACEASRSTFPATGCWNKWVYQVAGTLTTDPSVGHVLIVIAQNWRRFQGLGKELAGLLTGNEKVTLCSCEHALLPFWWSRRLGMHTLSDMGWRAPVAWRTPMAMKALNWEQREQFDVDEPLCEPTDESRSSVGPFAAVYDADTSNSDSGDEEELVWCFRGGCCVEDGKGGAALADGRFAVPA